MNARNHHQAATGQSADQLSGWRTHNAGRILSNALHRFEERVLSIMQEAGHAGTRRSHVNLTRHLDLDGTRITELARRAAMTNAAMTELIDQCVALGLVERHDDPSDRRVRIVRFTEAGRQWLAAFGQALATAEQELAREIGEPSLSVLLHRLDSYGEMVDSIDP